MTALRWIAVGVAAVVVLALAAITFVMASPVGARWVVGEGLKRSPYPVTVGAIEGTLNGPLVLRDVKVEQDGMTARVGRAVFDWKPLQLVRKRVEIDSLHVDGVVVNVPEGWAPPERPADDTAVAADTATGPPRVPELPVEVVVHDLRVGIERVTLENRGELTASTLTGRGTPEAFEAEARLAGAGGPVTSFEAGATAAGSPDAYRIDGTLAFTSGDLPPVEGTLATNGSLTELHVEEARLRTASGTADLVADVAWYPEITWSMTADADGLDVAPFTPRPEEWPGELSFRAASEGRMTESGPEASVRVADVGGELRGRPLAGGLEARVAGGRVELDTLGLSWGSLRVDAAGVVDETIELAFDLAAPDLGIALPDGGGSLQAEGRIAGTREMPRIDAEFEAAALRAGENGVERAAGTIELDLAEGATSAVDLRAYGLSAGARTVDSLVLEGAGTRVAHAARLHAHAGTDRVALGVSGGLRDAPVGGGGGVAATSTWTGQVDSLVVVDDEAGEWRLAGPAPLQISADAADLEPACLARDEAEVCLSAAWERDGPASGELTVAALPLDLLQPRMRDGLTIDGAVDGEGRFALSPGQALSGEGAFRADGTLDAEVGGQAQRFRIGGEGLRFALTSAGFEAALDGALTPESGDGDLRAEGRLALPGYTSTTIALEEQPIEGGLDVRSDDLAFLAAFADQVSDAGGTFRLTAEVTGTAAAPAVRGSMDITDGTFELPPYGLTLTDVQLEASGDPEGGVDVAGSMRSGEGLLSIEGRSPVEPSPDEPAEIRIRGERFLAIGTPEIQVEIAPDLEIRYDGELTRVRGRVAVPWARIELLEVPPTAVPPSADVVFVDAEEPAPPEVDADVEVVIGDDFRFEGMGFASMIEGELQVRERPGRDPIVLGELRFVDGKFASYGQNLDIDPGRVVFSGPVEDAHLEVTALRTASDGTIAGFDVAGGMREPEVRIVSEPSMSDADALSYIMYGKNLNEGDPSQQEAVAGAVAGLGANVVTTKIAGKVGLDEARIEGATKEQAELVTGKYLTPSLYVSYGLGLFKPSNTFRIKYLLSSNWAVQAESGDANGGDVLYQIERGN